MRMSSSSSAERTRGRGTRRVFAIGRWSSLAAAPAGPRIVAIAQDERSQARNHELGLARLSERERLAQALTVPRHRRPTRPTIASRERRLAAKRRDAKRKRARRPPEDGS